MKTAGVYRHATAYAIKPPANNKIVKKRVSNMKKLLLIAICIVFALCMCGCSMIRTFLRENDDYFINLDCVYYDEDEMDLTDAMKASISEARRRAAEADAKRNSVSGPAFDPAIKDLKEPVGPDGSSRVIPVGKGSEE